MLTAPYTITRERGLELELSEITWEIPPMSDDEFARLSASIGANGQLQPIVLFNGRVIDGRHRTLALREHAEIAEWIVCDFYDGDPREYSISTNIVRRHLSAGQRAMMAARRVTSDRGRPASEGGMSLPRAASMYLVSPRYVTEARGILAAAGSRTEIVSAVLSGTMSLAEARRRLRGSRVFNTPEYAAQARAERDHISPVPPAPEIANLPPPVRAENGSLIDQIISGSIDPVAWAHGMPDDEANRLLPLLERFVRLAYDSAHEEGRLESDPVIPLPAPRRSVARRSRSGSPF